MTDGELLKLFQKNPDAALDRIMTQHTGLVYFIVSNQLSTVSSVEDIEECVIDVFTKCIRKEMQLILRKDQLRDS